MIREPGLKAYMKNYKLKNKLTTSASSLKFGTGLQKSIGPCRERLPLGRTSFMVPKISIIQIQVLFLFKLQLSQASIQSLNFENLVLKSVQDIWKISVYFQAQTLIDIIIQDINKLLF